MAQHNNRRQLNHTEPIILSLSLPTTPPTSIVAPRISINKRLQANLATHQSSTMGSAISTVTSAISSSSSNASNNTFNTPKKSSTLSFHKSTKMPATELRRSRRITRSAPNKVVFPTYPNAKSPARPSYPLTPNSRAIAQAAAKPILRKSPRYKYFGVMVTSKKKGGGKKSKSNDQSTLMCTTTPSKKKQSSDDSSVATMETMSSPLSDCSFPIKNSANSQRKRKTPNSKRKASGGKRRKVQASCLESC